MRAQLSVLAAMVLLAVPACGSVESQPDAPTTGTLTVTTTGDGAVASSPAGIQCGATCVATFDLGAMVTLTATPGAAAAFSTWTGACSGAAPTCTLTIAAATTVGATFVVARDTITVVPTGDGSGTITSSPPGLACPGPCTLTVDHGAQVTLTAAPAVGSTFVGWTGGGCTGAGTCTTTVTDDLSIQAAFALDRSLVVTRAGNGSGTVTSNPTGIACGATCTATFAPGTVVTLTQAATAGSTFTGWSGACAGTGACMVTMNAAQMVTATFTLNQYTLTVARAGAGIGTVTSNPAGVTCGADCTEVYNHGTAVTLTATPASGSAFSGWSGACTGTGTCAVTMTAARSVTATFIARGWLYTIRDSDDVFQRGNPATGALTDVGPLGAAYAFGDCAYNTATDVMYVVDGRGAKGLYRVSLTTGAATMAGLHNIADMFALAYDAGNGLLYGVAGDGNLYRLNTTTGAATLVGATGASGTINGLAWDSTRSRLVALTALVSGASVYSINVTTGAATALATGLAGIDNNGWTYDPVIDRLWALDYGGNIYQYNPATFARTTIATGAGNHTCVAFVP